MRDLLGNAGLLDSRDRITSTNDGDGSGLLGSVGNSLGDGDSTLGEVGELEDTHGTVPDDGVGGVDGVGEVSDGLGTNIETHPTIRNRVDIDLIYRQERRETYSLEAGISGELVSNNDIGRKEELDALGLGLLDDLTSLGDEVLLNEGGTDLEAHGLVEGEDHASTDEDGLALLHEGLEDRELGGDLGSTDDGGEGSLGVVDGAVEVLELLLKEDTGEGDGDLGGDATGGGVGSVGSTEGIVDVEVGMDGIDEGLDELGLVLGLAGVETDVLEEDDVAVLHGIDLSSNVGTSDLVGLGDGLVEEGREAGGDLGIEGRREERTGSRVRAASGPFLGLPRWLVRMTLAPFSVRS